MITIGFSTREIDESFIDHLKAFSGVKDVEIIPFENKGTHSLTEAYNDILERASHDIVILCHDDIYFDNNGFGNRVIKHFKRNPEHGILGVAGGTKLPESAKWWEDTTRMRGIVNHESGGKKWKSEYSPNLGNKLDDVVLVDGVFIALHKNRIKKTFNIDISGFHFYDIDFSFRNFIEGVKIGVMYDVRITHKSIGETNDEWEKNRKSFAEKHSDQLPVKVSPNLNIDSKINVLLTGLFFKDFTGSEMYMYELAKGLKRLNCDVTVVSDINGPLARMAKTYKINTLSFAEYPGYKVGDGNWALQTPDGPKRSKPHMMYRVGRADFDIIHTQHKPITERVLQLYPNKPKIVTIHSEVISLEDPVIDDTIHSYVAIRPEIKEKIIKDGVNEDLIEVIYNPIDGGRFNTKNTKDDGYILFVGTIDYLRKNTIYDISEYAKNSGKELWLVGKDSANYLDDLLQQTHIKYFEPTSKVEDYVKNASETAGILLGRTTIESWLCGKSSWIYDVDDKGLIKGKELHEPPEDVDKFIADNVARKIKEQYIKVLNEW